MVLGHAPQGSFQFKATEVSSGAFLGDVRLLRVIVMLIVTQVST